LVVDISIEVVVGSNGLGYEINQVLYANDIPAMYALVFVAGVIGLIITFGSSMMERKLLHWHHSQRQGKSE